MKKRNTNQNNMHVDCVSKPAVVILYGVLLTVAPVFVLLLPPLLLLLLLLLLIFLLFCFFFEADECARASNVRGVRNIGAFGIRARQLSALFA